MSYEPKPTVGETMRSYCDCANRARDASQPVLTRPVLTTWICKSSLKVHLSESKKAFEYYWECCNCGKKRMIGVWDDDVPHGYHGDGSHLKDDPTKKEKNDCFVATAVYASSVAPEVVLLRRFRDTYLIRHRVGRAIVRTYCYVGPRLAALVCRHPSVQALLRRYFFAPIVRILRCLLAARLS